jgi:hypothetical protein
MGALSFSSPLLLIALAALPAIWLLLRATPPPPQQVKFPAFDLLRNLAKTSETPHRTPWWLLLLRLAIAALAIVGLSGPILNAPLKSTGSGPLLVIVDNDWAAAPGWRLRRDAMKSVAEQALAANRDAYLLATADENSDPLRPLTGAELRDLAGEIEPQPFMPDYQKAIAQLKEIAARVRDAEVIWLSDGVAHQGADEMMARLKGIGAVTVHADETTPALALYPPTRSETVLTYRIDNISAAPWRGDIVGLTRDGRELARNEFDSPAGAEKIEAGLDLPLALQNDLALARLDGVSSAGAVQLADARQRRALVGFVASGEAGRDPLLAGSHYVQKALAPYAVFVSDSLDNLVASDASVIVLDDIGVIRRSDTEKLRAWAERGGVIIRFAGPNLAEAAEDATPPLLPVALRGGGRAFGGTLTWETPQLLGAFSKIGPFADLVAPTDVFIRQQVLAEPGGETSARSWASLSDGTPLVTGESIGAGAIALFHVTATPDWSDLPLSSVFVDMLRRLVFVSTLGPESLGDQQTQRAAPYRVLDGFGALKQPGRDLAASTLEEISSGPAIGRPPGLYGAPEAPIALNAVAAGDEYKRFAASGAQIRPYLAEPPVRIAPVLFLIAVLLLLADMIVALHISGRLPFVVIALAVLISAPVNRAFAEPLNRPIQEKEEEAALVMRLAYVKTGDPATDRISEAGLRGLSLELTRRTSAEPAAPVGIDLETDDLSVYPFLYWPMTPGAAAPTELALANIETFMRFGGLIVFDTRDDERAVTGVDTPEGAALKNILSGLDMPPLAPVSDDHVLYRSFYLLADLGGRMATRPVWVQAGGGPNDSVTPVIIGGRDWAGAWASNALGQPLLPVRTTARPCTNGDGVAPRSPRECTIRAGVNMVMVALTGNYKSDQVHAPVLLERLGRP